MVETEKLIDALDSVTWYNGLAERDQNDEGYPSYFLGPKGEEESCYFGSR